MKTLLALLFTILLIGCQSGNIEALPSDAAIPNSSTDSSDTPFHDHYLPQDGVFVNDAGIQPSLARPGGDALSHAFFYANAYLDMPSEGIRADCARALTLDGAIHEMMVADSVWLRHYSSPDDVRAKLETIRNAREPLSDTVCFPDSDIFTRFKNYDPYDTNE